MVSKPEVSIDRWAFRTPPDPYKAPEALPTVLTGHVEDHPSLPDGPTTTSRVVRISIVDKEVETLNTLYRLKEPDPDFVRWLEENGKRLEDFDKEGENDDNS